MYFKQSIGKLGEDIACLYLEKNNYKIIKRNFRCKQGELDIIAFNLKKELIFIEVKTRNNINYGFASAMSWIYFLIVIVIIGVSSFIISKGVYYYD